MTKYLKNILSDILIISLLFAVTGVNINYHVCEETGNQEVYVLDNDCSCHETCDFEAINNCDECAEEHHIECCNDNADLKSLNIETTVPANNLKLKVFAINTLRFKKLSNYKNFTLTKEKIPEKTEVLSEPQKIISLISFKLDNSPDEDLIS